MACFMNYTVGCIDINTGSKGCFLFDLNYWRYTGEFKAVSPVFSGLGEFYNWDEQNDKLRSSCYIERLEND